MKTESSSQLFRSFWLITGSRLQLHSFISEVFRGNEMQSLYVSDTPIDDDTVSTVSYKQARGYLGQEKQVVVFDVSKSIDADALAVVSGLVVGGGSFILCMPPQAEWHDEFSSNFSKRFIAYLQAASFIKVMNANDKTALNEIKNSLKVIPENSDFTLTDDQKMVVDEIKTLSVAENKSSLVVVSDRGRGKSTSLGVVAKDLLMSKTIKILITAPRFKACEVAFLYLRENLPESKLRQACIQYEQSEFRFMAPEEILQSETPVKADLLLVDEAASIPLPMLKQLSQQFEQSVFVSTVHGYEGTGRGFSLRFSDVLSNASKSLNRIEMKTPVRWKSADPLEAWLFEWLCLDADIVDVSEIQTEKVRIRELTQTEIIEDEPLLRQVFSLLVLAHYKTRPSDLQRMLDDKVMITIAEMSGKVVAVVLSADEGGFDAAMSTAIYQGHRRPAGNLLAQTLTYHCGVESAATAASHRIMRIVVHPQLQNNNIGSQLLTHLVTNLKTRGIDLLGASFGLTESLANFWQKNGFTIVRVGFKKEQSSGEHAALYVRSFTEAGASIVNKAVERFSRHYPLLKKTALKDIRANIKLDADTDVVNKMSVSEREDIESFIKYSRAYELCIAGVSKWVRLNLHHYDANKDNALFHEVLNNVIVKHMSWKQVVTAMKLDGKKQAQHLFKQAVIDLYERAKS